MSGPGRGPGDGEKPPLKVTDKRAFTPDGKPRDDVPQDETSPAKAGGAEPSSEHGEQHLAEEIDFTTFLLSLAANAMHHLGEGPEGPVGTPNLPLAKQTIDIVALLQSKTRGNLSGEEERLLEGILYDLRMRFVAATRRKGAPDAAG